MNQPEQRPEPAVQPVASAPSTPPASGTGSSFLNSTLLLLSLLMGGYSFYRSLYPTHANQITVVDSDRLAASYIQEALADTRAGSDPVAVQQRLQSRLNGLQSKLDAMSAEGRLIVRNSAVLTYPESADATAQVAAELGITLTPDNAAAQPLPSTGGAVSPLPAVRQPENGTGTLPTEPAASALGSALD